MFSGVLRFQDRAGRLGLAGSAWTLLGIVLLGAASDLIEEEIGFFLWVGVLALAAGALLILFAAMLGKRGKPFYLRALR